MQMAPKSEFQGFNLSVSAPWWEFIEIKASKKDGEEFKIYLSPSEADRLIEQLQDVKDALLEHSNLG